MSDYSPEQIERAQYLLEDTTDGCRDWAGFFVPGSRAIHAILRARGEQAALLEAATEALKLLVSCRERGKAPTNAEVLLRSAITKATVKP